MPELVPNLSAPASKNACRSSTVFMPPAAFICTSLPTCSLNSFTSSSVAPAVPKPVEVLMKSAPTRVTQPQSAISLLQLDNTSQ